MPSSVTVRVEGLKELGQRLGKLSSAVATKGARSATSAAAGVVKKGAKAKIKSNPSIDEGDLYDAVIVKRLGKGESDLTSEHIVTVRGRGKPYNKKGAKIARAPHAHLVEFGTVNMPAEPYLRPGFEENKQQALDAMVGKLKTVIQKAGA
jgi:HK97 gp10 family phage protein